MKSITEKLLIDKKIEKLQKQYGKLMVKLTKLKFKLDKLWLEKFNR